MFVCIHALLYSLISLTGVVESFIRFLGMTLQGRLSERVTVTTLTSYIWTLFSLLSREGNVHIPNDVRKQIHGYIGSSDFCGHVQLSTRLREKHYASLIDIRILVDSYYSDARRFRTNRMRLQMIALTNLLALSAERIGALVESNCYQGTNEALKWKDVGVMVFPRSDSPSKPDIAVQVTTHLLKGGRGVESYSKTVFLFPEYGSERAYCPVVPFLVLGLLDQVWEGINSVEDIISPRVPPALTHTLRVRTTKRDLPVFRSEVRMEQGWATSASKAMSYGDAYRHLRFFSCLNGFPGMNTCFAHVRFLLSEDLQKRRFGHMTSVAGRPIASRTNPA